MQIEIDGAYCESTEVFAFRMKGGDPDSTVYIIRKHIPGWTLEQPNRWVILPDDEMWRGRTFPSLFEALTDGLGWSGTLEEFGMAIR